MVQACVFCGDELDSREHVLSRWLLEIWDPTGPFTARIDGKQRVRKTGELVHNAKMWRVMLPCCGICNGDLDRLFEKPAKNPVRRLIRDMQPLEDQIEISNIARWAIKTLALLAHPDARHNALPSGAEGGPHGAWRPYPRELLDSIKVGAIPTDTSLWFAVSDPNRPGQPDSAFEEVLLRHTSRADGLGGRGRARTTGFGLADGRLAVFQLAYHPLHDFEHPFERDGFVTRLWPNPPAHLEVQSHPAFDQGTRLAQVFIDDGFSHGLTWGQRSHGSGPPRDQW